MYIGAVSAQRVEQSSAETVILDSVNKPVKPIYTDQANLFGKRPINFVPNPSKAVWYSALFPGLGQLYNRKYWKLPLVYGGFMGITYALAWNGQYLKDYTNAYSDLKDDNPNTTSYLDILPTNMLNNFNNGTLTPDQLGTILKNRKDYFRRNRDLSIICMVGLYFVTMIDAYVDAQLFQFDINPDLSLRVEPVSLKVNQINNRSQAFGLQCSINF